ncbi:hypothetical protein [Paraglaciecola hydrolytica]|uniref:Motility protein n=1 Tax=Paraglaciecola hydrolytica TaxID=1799789 RepID=A0A136A4W8_9ALTE|nr:hypothetical protein [Paraglaciecola hydrolytica]KXI30267.1 hypothetical protein AX660_09805 [Paraglaciecola hydrolytica]
MDIQGAGSSGASGAALEVKALQLAKSQQEREGKATLQLLDSAADVPKISANGTLGSNVDTFA